jgi:hypothetical protein
MSGSVSGSSPNWIAGYVPPATEWNNLWAGKADRTSPAFTGAPFLPLGGGTMSGALNLRAGTPGASEAISKSYADAHYAIIGSGSGGPITGSSGDFAVGGNLSVAGSSTLNGATTVNGVLSASSGHINGNFSVGSKFSIDSVTGQLSSGAITAAQNILASTSGIGLPCVSVYSSHIPSGGGPSGGGMWVDHTTSVTEDNLILGSVDSSGAPLVPWFGVHLNTLGLFSTGDVFFTMAGGALWFGNLTTWVLNSPTAQKPGGGTWAASSDERIKRDVVGYDQGLGAILALRPVRYRYRDNWSRSGQREGRLSDEQDIEYVGLVAQEVEAVMPEMVGRIEAELDGVGPVDDFRTLDTTALTFALVNACKELAARVTALEQP